MHEYRKRKKKLDKEREQAFIVLKAENKALKQMLSRLREENESLKG
jgi:transposase-like protein